MAGYTSATNTVSLAPTIIARITTSYSAASASRHSLTKDGIPDILQEDVRVRVSYNFSFKRLTTEIHPKLLFRP